MIIPGIVASQITTPTSTNWVYVGTSGLYDMSVSRGIVFDKFGNPVTSCSTSSSNDSWLTLNYPPSGYAIGYRVRVDHGYSGGPCTPHYFEAQ